MAVTRQFNAAQLLFARHNKKKPIHQKKDAVAPQRSKVAIRADQHWLIFIKAIEGHSFTSKVAEQHFHHVFDAMGLLQNLKSRDKRSDEIFSHMESICKFLAQKNPGNYFLLVSKYHFASQQRLSLAQGPVREQLALLRDAETSLLRSAQETPEAIQLKKNILAENDCLAKAFYDTHNKRYQIRYGAAAYQKAEQILNYLEKGYNGLFIKTPQVEAYSKMLLEQKAELKKTELLS